MSRTVLRDPWAEARGDLYIPPKLAESDQETVSAEPLDGPADAVREYLTLQEEIADLTLGRDALVARLTEARARLSALCEERSADLVAFSRRFGAPSSCNWDDGATEPSEVTFADCTQIGLGGAQ